MPYPYSRSRPLGPRSRDDAAELSIRCATAAASSDGQCSRTSAATAATNGAAIDVPLTDRYPPGHVESIITPGAATPVGPLPFDGKRLEKSASCHPSSGNGVVEGQSPVTPGLHTAETGITCGIGGRKSGGLDPGTGLFVYALIPAYAAGYSVAAHWLFPAAIVTIGCVYWVLAGF